MLDTLASCCGTNALIFNHDDENFAETRETTGYDADSGYRAGWTQCGVGDRDSGAAAGAPCACADSSNTILCS